MEKSTSPKPEAEQEDSVEILEAEYAQEPDVETDGVSEAAGEPSEASEVQQVSMPAPLLSLFAKMLLGAAGAAVLSTSLLFYFRTIQCSIGYLLSAYLVYQALALRHDFQKGQIIEKTVICSSVNNLLARSNSRVVFRSVIEKDTDVPEYYEFYIPGSGSANKDLIPTYVYVIYYRQRDPKKLLGYFQL